MNPNPIDLSSALEKYTAYEVWKEFYPEAVEEAPNGYPVYQHRVGRCR
jgi:hypothetical protein